MLPLRAEIRTDAPILDERSAARRTLRLEVSATSQAATTALIHNLSEEGLLLETSADLQVGEVLQVDLPQAGTTTALVVWSRGNFAGCEFVSPVSKAAVSAALLKNPAERAQPVEDPTVRTQSSGDYDLVEQEQALNSRTVLLVSLLIALAAATLFIVALLTAPFSTF
jgi:hypothetical protein